MFGEYNYIVLHAIFNTIGEHFEIYRTISVINIDTLYINFEKRYTI